MRGTLILAIVYTIAHRHHHLAADDVVTRTYPGWSESGELACEANFYLYIPPWVKRLRGVIVHQHGCGTGAETGCLEAAYDLYWRALADAWDCAYLGTSYRGLMAIAAPGPTLGLAPFAIWCDGEEIARVAEKTPSGGLFQGLTFRDTPHEPIAKRRSVRPTTDAVYEVQSMLLVRTAIGTSTRRSAVKYRFAVAVARYSLGLRRQARYNSCGQRPLLPKRIAGYVPS